MILQFKQKNGDETRLFPFRRISKWWKSREDNMASVLKMCQFVTKYDIMDERVKKNFMDKDGWIHFANGECFRFHIMEENVDINMA